MATPIDNTEVIRMIKDFKKSVYKSATPLHIHSPAFSSYSGYGRGSLNLRAETAQIATKLNFSNLDDTTKMLPHTSSILDDTFQTPELLKRKLANAEVELQASKAALKEKESIISLMEPASKRACISLEQKLERSEKKLQAGQESVIQLENRLKYALNDVTFAKNRVRELENEKKLECDKLQMKLLALQQECSDLKLEVSNVKSNKAETVRKLNNDIGRLELKLSSITQEATMSKEMVQSLKQQVQEWTEKATLSIDLQKQLTEAQLKIKGLEDQIQDDEEKMLVVNTMQADLKSMPELRKENAVIKEELAKFKDSNVALYQEKMWSLQEKLTQAEKKGVLLAKFQVENELLMQKIGEWESLFDVSPQDGKKSPSKFSRKLSQYQKNEIVLTNKLSKMTAHCESVEKEKKNLETELEDLKKNSDQMKLNVGNYEPHVKRLQRRILMVTRERDMCRKLIDSYIEETSLSRSAASSAHVKNLEETIMEYRNSLEKADKEIDDLEKQLEELTECSKLKEQRELEIKQLGEDKSKLLIRMEQMEKEKSELEAKVSRPHEDKPAEVETKFIHLRCNPFDMAVQKQAADLKTLREENDRLRKRIKVLEEEGASAIDITARVEEKLEKEGSDTLLQSLRDQLAAMERQNKMIIDTARSKSREFREAVYSLTGYKVDIPVTGKYKLSHMYADSSEDFLMFECNQRSVNLLETNYSKSLTDCIEMYLQGYDSVPGFLASLTLDLFKRQTYIAQKSMEIS